MFLYCIVPIADVTQRMVNSSQQTRISSLRLNKAGTHTIFKFPCCEKPEALFDYEWLTKDEIKEKLRDGTW